MHRTEAFCPDWVSAPGETISDILRERRLSVSDFCRLIGYTPEQATDLLGGEIPITIGLARKLKKVVGGSVEFWMSRDFNYRRRTHNDAAADNSWLKGLPFDDMVRFGWLKPAPVPSEELAACLNFFGVPSVAVWHRVYAGIETKFSFRTSLTFESNPGAVAAWLRRGEIEAQTVKCGAWSARDFEASLTSLRALTRDKDPARFVPVLRETCARNGVAVAIVRSPSGCRASGATRFIAKDRALLLLSFRYLSDDQFWFSFFHEAGHLLLHSRQEIFLEEIEGANSPLEREASDFATHKLIPSDCANEFACLRSSTYDIARFARRIGISPGIVVGQLQHLGRIKNSHFNGLKRRYKW